MLRFARQRCALLVLSMNPYDDLVSALNALRRESGGSPEERSATAALCFALIHYELMRLVSRLRQDSFEAAVLEDSARVSIKLDGKYVDVTRFSGQAELVVAFVGFDTNIVPYEKRTQRVAVPTLTIELCQHYARETVRAIGEIWRNDCVARQRATAH